ncbi:cardiolipin synthase [Bacteroidota bacterium]
MTCTIFTMFDGGGLTYFIIDIVLLLTILFGVVIVILENKNPIKTISWILVIIFLPIIGIILYLYFGRNFRKKKFFNRKEVTDAISFDLLADNQLIELNQKKFLKNEKLKSKRHIMKLLINNNRALVTENNIIKVLNNGKQTFSSIIFELENAKYHINLEYYIIEDDNIGNKIKDILIKKAKEGLIVNVIYDDIGSWSLSRKFILALRIAGVNIYSFMPVKTYFFANKVNYRNHRKIIVIDGKIGFVGGLNIADRYLREDKSDLWRDTHLKLEGDAVKSLQSVFLMDWFFVSGNVLNVKKYFPEHHVEKHHLVQIAASGPDSDWASIMQAFFIAITTARNYVYISTPYFLPNTSIMTALKTVVMCGVDVKIILPEKLDSFMIRLSSQSYIEELLEVGVQIYYYHKGFTHSKLIIVDDVFSSVGTANMDIRSFDQNFEINALIYDEEIAVGLKNDFIDDLKNSYLITYKKFVDKSIFRRFIESVARIFSPLL